MPIDQTTIKTLYVFVEIAIDSAHVLQTIRLNFPSDRRRFHETLLDSEDGSASIPAGQALTRGGHLRIEGPESSSSSGSDPLVEPTRLALVSTIQFVAALSRLKDDLSVDYSDGNATSTTLVPAEASEKGGDERAVGRPRLWEGKYDATIPRSKPLSPGEILGCTAPQLNDVDALLWVALSDCIG